MFRSTVLKCRESFTTKSACSDTMWGVESVRTQEGIAERLTKRTLAVAHCHEQPEGAKGCRSSQATVHRFER